MNSIYKSITEITKNHLKKLINRKFSAKYLLTYGLHLGGHINSLAPEASSIVLGLRTQNMVINLNLTALELQKTLNIIRGLGFKRSVIYFINSLIGFRMVFKNCFKHFNQHLFFKQGTNIDSVFRKFPDLVISSRMIRKVRKYKKYLKKQSIFLFRNGKTLLQKIYISTKWTYGFVSNASSFFSFTDNVLHEKVRFAKVINTFEEKILELVDLYPFLPHYGFIGDHRQNYWIVNEFKWSRVPCTSVVDSMSHKGLLAMYGIAGNACSTDSTICFLILMVTNYLAGFYQQIYKFCLSTFIKILKQNAPKKNFFQQRKNFFFKKFLVYKYIT